MNLPFTLNPVLEHLPVYQPGRPIAEVAREMGLPENQIIKLASNENPLGPSPAALAALRRGLRQLHLYPDGNAFYFKQKLAAKLGLEPKHLILGNGSNDIIEFLGHALMNPDAEVVVSQYCFAIYPIVARLFGARVVTVPAKNYGHDLAAMRQAITVNTKIVFVANPNNPTGTLAPAAEVMAFLNDLPPSVVLAMDEAYLEFLRRTAGFGPADSGRAKAQSHPHAHILQDLWAGRFAARLRDWPSGFYRRFGKNPAAVQYQRHGPGSRTRRAG